MRRATLVGDKRRHAYLASGSLGTNGFPWLRSGYARSRLGRDQRLCHTDRPLFQVLIRAGQGLSARDSGWVSVNSLCMSARTIVLLQGLGVNRCRRLHGAETSGFLVSLSRGYGLHSPLSCESMLHHSRSFISFTHMAPFLRPP